MKLGHTNGFNTIIVKNNYINLDNILIFGRFFYLFLEKNNFN